MLILGCLHYGTATLNLNSTVDGRRAACPEEVVTYSCSVTGAFSITWTAASVLVDATLLRFTPTTQPSERMRSCSDPSSPIQCAALDYQATLTSVGTLDMNGAADLTSTFRFTATAELNGTVVRCSAAALTGAQMDNQDLIVADPPDPPQNVNTTDQQNGRENVILTVQWQPPEDDGRAPVSYIITVSPGSIEVNTNETSAVVTIPYNMEHNVSIVAMNCNENSSAVMGTIPAVVNCSVPAPPGNGSIDPYQNTLEGAEISFRCNPGYLPTETMTAVCNSTWTPYPAALACICDNATNVCTSPPPPPSQIINVALIAGVAGGVGGGLLVVSSGSFTIILVYCCCCKKVDKRKDKLELEEREKRA